MGRQGPWAAWYFRPAILRRKRRSSALLGSRSAPERAPPLRQHGKKHRDWWASPGEPGRGSVFSGSVEVPPVACRPKVLPWYSRWKNWRKMSLPESGMPRAARSLAKMPDQQLVALRGPCSQTARSELQRYVAGAAAATYYSRRLRAPLLRFVLDLWVGAETTHCRRPQLPGPPRWLRSVFLCCSPRKLPWDRRYPRLERRRQRQGR